MWSAGNVYDKRHWFANILSLNICYTMKQRALRRHHYQRLKRKRRNHYGGYGRHRSNAQGRLANTATLCSCWMCGNPRKYFGEVTRQEILAALNFAEQMNL